MRIYSKTNYHYIIFFIYSIIAIYSSYLTAISNTGTDFDIIFEEINNFYINKKEIQFLYSHLYIYILKPFLKFNAFFEFVINILNYWFLFLIFKIINNWLEIKNLDSKNKIIYYFLSIVVSIQIISYNISRCQIIPFLLWSILYLYNSINNKNKVFSICLFSFGLVIKLVSSISLLYFFLEKKVSFFLYLIFFITLFLFIPSINIGIENNAIELIKWGSRSNPFNNSNSIENIDFRMVSLSSVLPFYLKTLNINLSFLSYSLFINFLRFFFIFLFYKFYNTRSKQYSILFLIALIPFVAPHQQKYSLLFSIPLLFVLILQYIKKTEITFLLSFLFWFVILVFSPFFGSDILGKSFFNFLQSIKIYSFCLLTIYFIAFKFINKKIY